MKFKIGDFVRFVDEAIEGHITSFQPDDIVGVTDDSGFEIPVPANKITRVHGNMRRDDDEPKIKASVTNTPFIERGIYIGITGEQKDGIAQFYIVNHSSYDLLLVANEINGAKRTGVFADKILAQDFVPFYAGNFSQVGKWPSFEIQILRHSPTAHQATPFIQREFKVRPLDLIQPQERDPLLERKAWRYQLDKLEENIGLDKLKDHFISHRPHKR